MSAQGNGSPSNAACANARQPAGVTVAISSRDRSGSGMRANQNVAPPGSVVKPKAALLPRIIR